MENTAEPSFFTPDQLIRDQVSYCGYFLVIKGNEVGLIHQSAKDYLLRKTWDSNPELEVFRVKEEVANHEIARRCLVYLESGVPENIECELEGLLRRPGHLRDFPLLSYAALHWHEHARSLARSEDIFDLSLPFYHKTSPIRTSWFKAYWFSKEYRRPPESFTLLHLASYLGILPLAEKLVLTEGGTNKSEHSCCLKKVDGGGKTALMWAARSGHEAVVRLLLKEGADIEARDKDGETALIRAAERGHEVVIRLLLEKGANMEAKNRLDRTALVIAAHSGYDAVIRLLLEKGADIEARDKDGETALMIAAKYREEAVIQLLLEKGADINATDKNEETALMIAAKSGEKTAIQLLLKKGADINAKNKNGETALMIAVRKENRCASWKKSDYEAIIRLLTPNLES